MIPSDDTIWTHISEAYETAIESAGQNGSTDQSTVGLPNISGVTYLLIKNLFLDL